MPHSQIHRIATPWMDKELEALHSDMMTLVFNLGWPPFRVALRYRRTTALVEKLVALEVARGRRLSS